MKLMQISNFFKILIQPNFKIAKLRYMQAEFVLVYKHTRTVSH